MSFPPSGPTGLKTTIPSYPYKEWDDDDDLWAFFNAYNSYTQDFVDWFNALNLPIYTDITNSALLDLVGTNLYGVMRPTIGTSVTIYRGPLNTFALNNLPLDGTQIDTIFASSGIVNDDIYKRVITWHTYRGDGRNTNVRWLKRRINRFLNGPNGVDYTGDTNRISVTFGPGSNLGITLVTGRSKVTKSAVLDTFACNTRAPNKLDVTQVATYPAPALGTVFKQLVDGGALELPIQYRVTCRIGVMGIV